MPFDLSYFNQARTAIESEVNDIYEQRDYDHGCNREQHQIKIIQHNLKIMELIREIERLNFQVGLYLAEKEKDTIEQLQRRYENNEISYTVKKALEEYIKILSLRLQAGFIDIIDETTDRLIHSGYTNPKERRKEILEMIERLYYEKIVAPLLEYNALVMATTSQHQRQPDL